MKTIAKIIVFLLSIPIILLLIAHLASAAINTCGFDCQDSDDYLKCVRLCNQGFQTRQLQEDAIEEQKKQTRILQQQLREQQQLERKLEQQNQERN